MMLWKLSPTTIVFSLVALLSLMVSLSPPVLSQLQTGYDYNTTENQSMVDLYKDLKCTYLFAGITHMQLTKLMLEDKAILTKLAIDQIFRFNIGGVICTLYNVTVVEIGSLWLLLFYAKMVEFYHKSYVAGNSDEAGRTAAVARLVDIHDYVMTRMQKELSASDCRPGNRFDSYEKWVTAQAARKPNVNYIRMEAFNNYNQLSILLTDISAQATYYLGYKALNSRNLFIDHLGNNSQVKKRLMTDYDVQVAWCNTFIVLQNSWNYVREHIFYKEIGLSPIKNYYNMQFSLLKVIAYRMTWKYLLYVKTFTGIRRVDYLKKWQDFLEDFQAVLCLQTDPDVAGLLVAIKRLACNDESIVNIIYQLHDKLNKINSYLTCKSTHPMTLEPESFHSRMNYITSGSMANQPSNLKNAKEYIAYLRFTFQHVDFKVIRSIVTYVDDETKW